MHLAPAGALHLNTHVHKHMGKRMPSRTRVRMGLPVPQLGFVKPQIFKSSLSAVTELITSSAIGYVATRKGVLDKNTLQALSKCVYNIFLPAMLFANVGRTMADNPTLSLAAVPALAWIQIILGFSISLVMRKVLNIDSQSEEGRELTVCSTFGNSGVLPLIFVNSLFGSRADPTLCSRAIAYVSFFLLGWSPTFWSIGKTVLSPGPVSDKDSDGVLAAQIPSSSFDLRLLASNIFSPPIIGSLTGLMVGATPVVSKLLFSPTAPFGVVITSVTQLGKAYAPCALLVLAGSLANRPRNMVVDRSTVLRLSAIALTRFLIMPVSVFGLYFVFQNLLHIYLDPLAWFVLIMESCMPSAQNAVIMLQVDGRADAASRLARTLFVMYLLAVIPVSLVLTLLLQVLKV